MSQSSINVTEGSGKRLNTWDRTISSVLVQDQFMLPGEYPYASYVALATNVSTATVNDHLLQLMAGSSNYVRIRRIRVEQQVNASAAVLGQFGVYRLTTAGTGGTSVTPAKLDTGDAASGATAMTLPSSKGTESTELLRFTVTFRSAVQSTMEDYGEWVQHPSEKPLIIPAGTSNGIAIKNLATAASASAIVTIEFVETSWLGA